MIRGIESEMNCQGLVRIMGPIGQKRPSCSSSPHFQKPTVTSIENNKITCCCFSTGWFHQLSIHLQYGTVLQSKAKQSKETYGPAAMNWIAYRIPVMAITRILKYLPVTVCWAILLSSVLYHHFDASIVGFDFNSPHHSHAFFSSLFLHPFVIEMFNSPGLNSGR